MNVTWTYGSTLGIVVMDATVQETHLTSATVTEHPVEQGQAVSDHVRPGADRISCECIVTNHPIAHPATQNEGVEGALQTTQLGSSVAGLSASLWTFNGEFDRVRNVYGQITRLQAEGTPVTIETSLKNYDNMVIVNVSAPRSSQYGASPNGTNGPHLNAITFTMDCQRVRIVQTQEVAPAAPKATKKKKGVKATKKTDEKTEPKQSALKKIISSITGGK